MPIVYDLLYLAFLIFYIPGLVFRKKLHRGLWARLGILPRGLKFNRPVWIHAVSVGEAMAVRGLVEELRRLYPQRQFVFSTVTPTGNRIIRSVSRRGDLVTYLPLDISFIVASVMDRVRPSAFIIAETEIWPNLLTCLRKRRIPVAVVNGRISDASFRGYRCVRLLLTPILKGVSLFCVQGARDGERLARLGVPAEKIRVSGNMKFDAGGSPGSGQEGAAARQALGLGAGEKLFVCGSTHPGEERAILDAFRDLLKTHPALRLLIAPRHPERAKEIEKLIAASGFTPARVSQLTGGPSGSAQGGQAVFILDTVGRLMQFYSLADIVFIGGSFIKKGGHNILEPASFGKPVLFGRYMFNFRDIADMFLANRAAVMVQAPAQLSAAVGRVLDDHSLAEELGRSALKLMAENKGATARNADLLKRLIPLDDSWQGT